MTPVDLSPFFSFDENEPRISYVGGYEFLDDIDSLVGTVSVFFDGVDTAVEQPFVLKNEKDWVAAPVIGEAESAEVDD